MSTRSDDSSHNSNLSQQYKVEEECPEEGVGIKEEIWMDDGNIEEDYSSCMETSKIERESGYIALEKKSTKEKIYLEDFPQQDGPSGHYPRVVCQKKKVKKQQRDDEDNMLKKAEHFFDTHHDELAVFGSFVDKEIGSLNSETVKEKLKNDIMILVKDASKMDIQYSYSVNDD